MSARLRTGLLGAAAMLLLMGSDCSSGEDDADSGTAQDTAAAIDASPAIDTTTVPEPDVPPAADLPTPPDTPTSDQGTPDATAPDVPSPPDLPPEVPDTTPPDLVDASGECMVTGCSAQVCAAGPVDTTCEYRCEYGCYAQATCEPQADGLCGWTAGAAFEACVAECSCGPTVEPSDTYYNRFEGIGADNACSSDADCIIGGCSAEICAAEALPSTCEGLPYGPSGSCGCVAGVCIWNDCSEPPGPDADAGTPDADAEPADTMSADLEETGPTTSCIATGCSGQVCAADAVITTCEYTCEYGCYSQATCEPQADGLCGWTTTAAYEACVAACSCQPSVDPSDPYFDRFEGSGFDNACTKETDCVASGCSGEVCAAEPAFTTCELLPYTPMGSCGCLAGHCVWNDCEP